jgi:hypothetical protein
MKANLADAHQNVNDVSITTNENILLPNPRVTLVMTSDIVWYNHERFIIFMWFNKILQCFTKFTSLTGYVTTKIAKDHTKYTDVTRYEYNERHLCCKVTT